MGGACTVRHKPPRSRPLSLDALLLQILQVDGNAAGYHLSLALAVGPLVAALTCIGPAYHKWSRVLPQIVVTADPLSFLKAMQGPPSLRTMLHLQKKSSAAHRRSVQMISIDDQMVEASVINKSPGPLQRHKDHSLRDAVTLLRYSDALSHNSQTGSE